MTLLVSNRSYRLLFSASAIPNLGDGVSALAFPWLATLITRDPALIALVAFATRLPWLLFAIPAGVLVDRRDRRRRRGSPPASIAHTTARFATMWDLATPLVYQSEHRLV